MRKIRSKDELAMKLIVHIVLLALVVMTLLPMALTIVVSLTDQSSIAANGYSLFPEKWSLDAYKYLLDSPNQLLRGYKNSIIITAFGTVFDVIFIILMAYPLSRPDFAYKKFFSVFVFMPMLFGGGAVASYLMIVKYLGWKNSFLAVTVPGFCASFEIFMMRVLFQDIPMSLQEAAKIDGASDGKTLVSIVLPLSKPAIATITLRNVLSYWNNTSGPQLYLTDYKKHPITLLLNNIVKIVEEMKQALLDPSMAGGNIIKAEDIPSDTITYALMVVATVPLLLVFTRLQKYFAKGMTAGGVKG
ncbi:MAG: carbohydrate ABC transporter permease [Lachnospiraceae bacterium]|nr:carbohydrate ABC transporter permease [Lachnospiraceae bacterium]